MEKTKIITSALERALSFPEYISLIEKLHLEQKATSFQENEEFYNYSVLSLKRMQRIYKKVEIESALQRKIESISSTQTWLIITESWCGDASQTVPILVKAAELNPHITVRIALRDSEEELMQFYLTDGGKSIPKLAIFDSELNEVCVWGPRPVPAQKKVKEYKALPDPKPAYSELSLELQKWYNTDKGLTTMSELAALNF